MAVALGATDRALIVVQFIRWIDYNKKEGRPATTHNGYDNWIKRHFWHLKSGAFGGHIRALETMGVLKTERIGRTTPDGPYDQRKSYRIDYVRLNALLAAVKKPPSDADVEKSKTQIRKSKTNGAHPSLNNDSNSSNYQSLKPQVSKPKSETQEEPTKPTGRGGRRDGAGRKRKQDALIEMTSDAAVAATEPSLVEASMGTAADLDSSSPSSAPPPSHPEAELMERMADLTLDHEKAAGLIEQYGADRVRAVVRECERRMSLNEIKRPAGWIIKELENDVFKLGEMPAVEQETDSDSHSLETDDIDDWDAQRRAELESREHICYPYNPSNLTVPVSGVPGTMTPHEIWNTAHHQLSLLFDRPSFDMWLKNAVLIGYEAGAYIVEVPTAHAQDMLQHRYYRNAQRVVEGLQNAPVTIRFVAAAPIHERPLSASERRELEDLRTLRDGPDEDDAPLLRLLAMHRATERGTYQKLSQRI
jgi:hypothetical protein